MGQSPPRFPSPPCRRARKPIVQPIVPPPPIVQPRRLARRKWKRGALRPLAWVEELVCGRSCRGCRSCRGALQPLADDAVPAVLAVDRSCRGALQPLADDAALAVLAVDRDDEDDEGEVDDAAGACCWGEVDDADGAIIEAKHSDGPGDAGSAADADFLVEGADFVMEEEAGDGDANAESEAAATDYQDTGEFCYDEFGGNSMGCMSNSGWYEVEDDDYDLADYYELDVA